MERDYICPMASDWAYLAEQLASSYLEDHPNIDASGLDLYREIGLPIPLILAGWVYSNDKQKEQRWDETIKWAEGNGLLWIIEKTPFRKHRSVFASK